MYSIRNFLPLQTQILNSWKSTLLITLNSAGILTIPYLKTLNSLNHSPGLFMYKFLYTTKKNRKIKLRRIHCKKSNYFKCAFNIFLFCPQTMLMIQTPSKDQPLFSHILPLPLFLISPFTTIYICIRLPFPLVADISGSSVNNQKGRGF